MHIFYIGLLLILGCIGLFMLPILLVIGLVLVVGGLMYILFKAISGSWDDSGLNDHYRGE